MLWNSFAQRTLNILTKTYIKAYLVGIYLFFFAFTTMIPSTIHILIWFQICSHDHCMSSENCFQNTFYYTILDFSDSLGFLFFYLQPLKALHFLYSQGSYESLAKFYKILYLFLYLYGLTKSCFGRIFVQTVLIEKKVSEWRNVVSSLK